jgi:gamma-D-glutamyl-L-lysine dipeptidyl-peptidase
VSAALAAALERLEQVRARHAPDPRTAVFEVEAILEGSTLTLTGVTSEAEAARELHRAVASIPGGLRVVDRLRLLPEADADECVHALVTASVGPMMSAPAVQSTQVSQAVLGTRLIVLRRDGRWMQCRGGDGYIGWIHAGYLALTDEATAREWETGSGGEPWLALGAEVLDGCGEVLARLPWHARVVRDGNGRVRLPDGRTGEVRGDLVPLGARRLAFPDDGAAIVASAVRWMGAPYLWGGITPWGVDCSGFVQALYRMHGVVLPRDSDQQSRAGAEVDAGEAFDRLLPGDLLFFSEEPGRCTHVALSTGGSGIVHASLGNGGVARNDMAGPRHYEGELRRCFRRAGRILRP